MPMDISMDPSSTRPINEFLTHGVPSTAADMPFFSPWALAAKTLSYLEYNEAYAPTELRLDDHARTSAISNALERIRWLADLSGCQAVGGKRHSFASFSVPPLTEDLQPACQLSSTKS